MTISRLIVHCSATSAAADIDAETIRKWHVEGNGWSDIGYNYVIKRDGTLENGRDRDGDGDVEDEVGAHARGFNRGSIGVCLVGGVDETGKAEANFTFKQYATLYSLCLNMHEKYPGIIICGHRDLPNISKDCPSFNVKAFLGD